MREDRGRLAILILAVFFFLLLPGHPLGFADGLPLDSFWDWELCEKRIEREESSPCRQDCQALPLCGKPQKAC